VRSQCNSLRNILEDNIVGDENPLHGPEVASPSFLGASSEVVGFLPRRLGTVPRAQHKLITTFVDLDPI
jgi:hypothetical protein